MPLPIQIRKRTLLPIVSLLLVWLCFYLVLRSSDIQRGEPRAIGSGKSGTAAGRERVVYPPMDVTGETESDPLEKPFERFFVPDLHISRLATILSAETVGLTLEYPAEVAHASLSAEYNESVTPAQILAAMLAPHGYTFMRQGNTIRAVRLESHTEKRRQPADAYGPDRLFEAHRYKAELQARNGEPFDIWLSVDPPSRLRILAQTLHSEFQEAAQNTGIVVTGLRDNEVWFRHQFETRRGQPGRIDVRAAEAMYCQVTPLHEESGIISLRIEMYYETYLTEN